MRGAVPAHDVCRLVSAETPVAWPRREACRLAPAEALRARLQRLVEACGLLEPEHQVEVLHRRTRGALAEIVEQRHQTHLAGFIGTEYIKRHLVGAVQAL